MELAVSKKSLFIRLTFVLSILVFRMMLDYYYQMYCEHFGYFGLTYAPREVASWAFSYITVLVLSVLIPLKLKRPSDMILLIFYLLSFVPISVLFAGDSNSQMAAFIGVFLVFFVLSLLQKSYVGSKKFSIPTLSMQSYMAIVGVFGLVCFVVLFISYGVNFQNLNPSSLYDVRDAYKADSSRFLTYAFNWFSHILNIIIFVVALRKRNYLLVCIAVAIQMYLFTLGGHKTVLFLIPFVFVVYWSVKYFKHNMGLAITLSLMAAMVFMIGADIYSGKYSILSSLFVRRGLLMPAQLFFDYVDFFSNNPIDWFAQNTPFNLFIDSHYANKIPYIIGDNYISPGRNIHANANLFADLFANLGYVGFLVGGLFLFFVMRIADAVSRNKSMLLVMPMFFVSITSLLNSGLIVNVITHGLLLMIILIALHPKVSFVVKKLELKPNASVNS